MVAACALNLTYHLHKDLSFRLPSKNQVINNNLSLDGASKNTPFPVLRSVTVNRKRRFVLMPVYCNSYDQSHGRSTNGGDKDILKSMQAMTATGTKYLDERLQILELEVCTLIDELEIPRQVMQEAMRPLFTGPKYRGKHEERLQKLEDEVHALKRKWLIPSEADVQRRLLVEVAELRELIEAALHTKPKGWREFSSTIWMQIVCGIKDVFKMVVYCAAGGTIYVGLMVLFHG